MVHVGGNIAVIDPDVGGILCTKIAMVSSAFFTELITCWKWLGLRLTNTNGVAVVCKNFLDA
jgi:hypothetical protein